ncbi:MAG: hypothetical protein KIT34_07385 [Cyanobacteria bacterium TGS_CYA1]|nr:hypothetical protein [Cyanobacteria bacterium TGS_CYA1]
MSGTCPFCGAKLNLGLNFCVGCGRQGVDRPRGQMSGLRGGFRAADITRRLDEIITVSRFRKSRKNIEVTKGARWFILNGTFALVAIALFYCAVQYSLSMLYPGKYKPPQIPVEKIKTVVQTTIGGMKVFTAPSSKNNPVKDDDTPRAEKRKEKQSASKSSNKRTKRQGTKSGAKSKKAKADKDN